MVGILVFVGYTFLSWNGYVFHSDGLGDSIYKYIWFIYGENKILGNPSFKEDYKRKVSCSGRGPKFLSSLFRNMGFNVGERLLIIFFL